MAGRPNLYSSKAKTFGLYLTEENKKFLIELAKKKRARSPSALVNRWLEGLRAKEARV